jgi:hypothetical protein
LAASVISKMQSGLSIRGTIRRFWRKARTPNAVSPCAARLFRAARTGSSASDAGPWTPRSPKSWASP